VSERLFRAVRAVITEGIDSPGVRDELHLAFYAERDAKATSGGVTTEGLREAVERLPHRHPTLAGLCLPDEHESNSLYGADLVEREAVLAALSTTPPAPEP
jgi:hypothetical protein